MDKLQHFKTNKPLMLEDNFALPTLWIYNLFCISNQEQKMQVAKWGNSLAVRLPAALVKELELEAGDEISLKQVKRGKNQTPELSFEKSPNKADLLIAIRSLRRPAPNHFKFDREEANQR
jgi:antitoxin MazE